VARELRRPGTEGHALGSPIPRNWRGRPLISHQTVVNLISSTTMRAGLIVKAAIDTDHYETEIKVSDEQMASLRLTPQSFHGEWNYALKPRK